jgi:signal peptidase II
VQGMVFLTQEAAAFGPLLVAAALILVLDQASKTLVLGRARRQPSLRPANRLMPRVRVHMNRNASMALVSPRIAFVALAVAAFGTMLLVHYAAAFQTLAARVALGAALGGAIGNFLDLVRRGAVVDFIDLRVWPVFNVADACIVLGAGAALWSIQ